VLAFSVVALGLIAALYRPLLLSSISPELAAARGIPVRLVGAGYLLALAVAVALAAFTIGTILSLALLVGPAATALRLTRSPGRAVLVATLIGIAATWLGILLAYDSYDWAPAGRGWPVSFFVVTLIFAGYLLAGLLRPRRRAPITSLPDPTAAPAQS
jgi:zinc/manganese transport system permease protein